MRSALLRISLSLIASLGFVSLRGVPSQEAEPNATSIPSDSSTPFVTPVPSISGPSGPGMLPMSKWTILLWPKNITAFIQEYSTWDAWLGGEQPTPYSPRDELLVATYAIATKTTGLEIATDEDQSDLIIVSGNPLALTFLIERLKDHPLLAGITGDSVAHREKARSSWAESILGHQLVTSQPFARNTINVRANRAANVVWGYTAPNTKIEVRLLRSEGHDLKTTTTSAANGLYHAYFVWDILAGDTIELNVGNETRKVVVPDIQVSVDQVGGSVAGAVLAPSDVGALAQIRFLDVIVGQTKHTAMIDSRDKFDTVFSPRLLHPGTPGFLRYTDGDGNRVFMPFSIAVVRVRRDTAYGIFNGSVHMLGLSSIVWGDAGPNASITVTLTQSGGTTITRTTTADGIGYYSVSVDRLIRDGDEVVVSDGLSARTVSIPVMNYGIDPAARIITGTAPANIVLTTPGAPHSLQISFGGFAHQITTTTTGAFSADFVSSAYLAGLTGSMRYTTANGDEVYKPVVATDPLVRGRIGDWRADVILGQPDFSQFTPNEVVSNKLFDPGGVYVDRSTKPNRIYVYDPGNSRILGLRNLGYVQAGPSAGQPCTSNSDYPNSICQIVEDGQPNLVFGQPTVNSSYCNGDSGYLLYPDVPLASANTLCGLLEFEISTRESYSSMTMATDAQGNLYVADIFNNRVLRYNDPFATDTIADYVWGQVDFSGVMANRGMGIDSRSDGRSLRLAGPYSIYHESVGLDAAGVAIDARNDLWVADSLNNRVLRFPFNASLGRPAQEADLVLGQPNLTVTGSGSSLAEMYRPASIRVNDQGTVYVADALNNRILVFQPPLSSGMSASRLLGSGLLEPLSLELDPAGGIWVNDARNHRLIKFLNEVQAAVISGTYAIGGLGLDNDGNVMVTNGGYVQEGIRYAAPDFSTSAKFLRAEPEGPGNATGARGFAGGLGLEITAQQLIRSDGTRLLFWNSPWNVANYQPADGVVGEPDFQTRHRWGREFGRMRADDQQRLWVLQGDLWGYDAAVRVLGYQLPLLTGATPVYVLTSPLPLQGGGIFTWTESLKIGGIEVQPGCDCLWLSDKDLNRVFRVRGVSTNPAVDLVLGQRNISEVHCNQGRDSDNSYIHPSHPSRDSLCHPGALAFDSTGNLFVADHSLEIAGNLRLLEFDANIIPDSPTSAVFGIPASRVWGRGGSFTEPDCLSIWEDPMCAPWEPTFDSQNRMIIGFNGYLGPRFPLVYQDPITNPFPIAALADFHSMPMSARFDQFDNLYVFDGNRSRILIYRHHQAPTVYLPLTRK